MAARELRSYFQAHLIRVLTEQPLHKILQDIKSSDRMINWAVELGEFDISYLPRPSVKGQALTDFIMECTIPEERKKKSRVDDENTQPDNPTQVVISERPEVEYWNLFFDGASNKSGSGADIILTSPDGFPVEYALALDFNSTNNEAKYEAMLVGLGLAQSLRAKNIRIHTDSQLMENQVTWEYEAKNERMEKYLKMVKAPLSQFDSFEVQHVPIDQNQQANLLSKLASGNLEDIDRPVNTEILQKPSIDMPLIASIMCSPDWMTSIRAYIMDGTLPDDSTEAQKLMRKVMKYTIIGGSLYKRSISGPFLKCLAPEDADYALQETHEGICR
ncbi:uncharacterized protein [Rutidosis leptorrhynchoides]|uniref:uncharacterized protein n=1 Tax=Rutidosis leptorrhynchoides TaxID=125765 RepID=UPI003A990884